MDGGGAEMGVGRTAGGVPGASLGSCAVGGSTAGGVAGGAAGGVPEIPVGMEEAGGERDGLVGVGNKPAGMAGRQADRDRIKSKVHGAMRSFILKSYPLKGLPSARKKGSCCFRQ